MFSAEDNQCIDNPTSGEMGRIRLLKPPLNPGMETPTLVVKISGGGLQRMETGKWKNCPGI
jgi:hypothetical protein